MRALVLLACGGLLGGCGACKPAGEADADREAGADGDADREAGADGDADQDLDEDLDAEADSDELPPPMPMEMVEVARDREGLDCGPGCRQVSFAEGPNYGEYAISERYLTYLGDGPRALYVVDLDDGREYRVDACPGVECSPPGLDADLLAYSTRPREGRDWNTWTLWRYRIGEPERHPLVRRTMTEFARPMDWFDVSGDTVAWYDSAVYPAGLHAMSLLGGEVTSLTRERCVCYGPPELAGRQVVYEGWQSRSRDIWLVDIDTLEEERLVDDPLPQFDPAFDGQWVVWADGRNDPSFDPYGRRVNPDIYGMDLATRVEEPLCDHPAVQLFPDVRDGLVVWKDLRNAADPNDAWASGADADIYALELATRRELQVTSLPGAEWGPRVLGRRVFFIARDLVGQWAIFVVDLDEAGLL